MASRVLEIPLDIDLINAIAKLHTTHTKEEASALIRRIVKPHIEIEDYKKQLELYKKQLDEATELAFKDPLTTAFNRRAYDILGNNLVRDCLTYYVPLSIMIFDVDDFKTINDDTERGHECGNMVLTELTKIIHESIRPSDSLYRLGNGLNNKGYVRQNGKKLSDDNSGDETSLYRIGGDEFILFFLGADAEKAFHVAAKRIHDRITAHDFTYNGKTFRIGISGGLATLEEDCRNLEELFKRADSNLYIVKRRGKNNYHSSSKDSRGRTLGFYRNKI
jgi:GGDEF domain-containing protein